MDINVMAENLKKLREEHSLTQESLAEALSVPVLAVYMWEAGRLALEYKALQRIAEFFETSVEKIIGEDPAALKAPESDKISFHCKICGGELIYDYVDCTCRCANCGNKWAIAELYPKYDHVISTIRKASEILSEKATLAAADEAKLLFKQAIAECSKNNDALAAELIKICKEGQATAKQLEIYCRGKYFFSHRSYKSALVELEKVRGFRDADEIIKRCRRQS